MSEYIPISEFAKRAGVSQQAIYKRLDKDLNPWLKVESKKKMLNVRALELFRPEQHSTGSPELATIMLLQKTVDMLEKELEIKNSQIEELNSRLKESYTLIDQQQKLHAIAEVSQPDPLPDTPKKRHWWQFGKD